MSDMVQSWLVVPSLTLGVNFNNEYIVKMRKLVSLPL